jgi:hypothetical protein
MLGTHKKTTILLSNILMICILSATAGCGSRTLMINPQPFLPADYYNCTQVEPKDLVNIYFTGYGSFTTTEAMYNDVIYVFKNVLVDKRMFIGLNEGFIWVDQIKCFLINPDEMKHYKAGDRIDVLGLNKGPTSYYQAGLTFKNCYVLPAGRVALPANPGAKPFTPGY